MVREVDNALEIATASMTLKLLKSKIIQKGAKSMQKKKENGHNLFKAGQFDEARIMFTEALQIDPSNVNFNSMMYFNRALVESKMGNHENAIADCTSTLKGSPTFFNGLLLRAKCHNHMNKYEKCIDDYKAALKFRPSYKVQQAVNEITQILKWFECNYQR